MNGLYGYREPRIGIPESREVGLYEADAAYYTILAGTVACYRLARWLVRSDFGRAIQGIKENEARIEYLGYDVPLMKLAVFVISSALAALAAGSTPRSPAISPDLVGLFLSTEVIVWVAVGGRGTLVGPLHRRRPGDPPAAGGEPINFKIWPLVIGLFFVAMVFLFPRGLLPLLRRPVAVRCGWQAP